MKKKTLHGRATLCFIISDDLGMERFRTNFMLSSSLRKNPLKNAQVLSKTSDLHVLGSNFSTLSHNNPKNALRKTNNNIRP